MAVRSEVSDCPTGEWGSFKWKTNRHGSNKSENQGKQTSRQMGGDKRKSDQGCLTIALLVKVVNRVLKCAKSGQK